METGRIIRIISNQYTIENENGTVIASPRGRMRLSEKPITGDLVEFETFGDESRINKVINRRNRLLRPSVANVDQAFIVTSAKDPEYSAHLLNRLIFLAALAGAEPVIVLTKSDLLDAEGQAALEKEMDLYRQAGYRVLITHPGTNDDELKEALKDRITVLCGQSGAGKSSLLNRLEPSFKLHTQITSKALGRGKHTTRHCELHHVADGLVADTPGFSSLDYAHVDTDHLDEAIIDFAPYLGECRFKDCKHLDEPDCAVKIALKEGKINPSIYEDYSQIMREAIASKKYGKQSGGRKLP